MHTNFGYKNIECVESNEKIFDCYTEDRQRSFNDPLCVRNWLKGQGVTQKESDDATSFCTSANVGDEWISNSVHIIVGELYTIKEV